MFWDHGFNRLSFGVQDFDSKVQTSVNRIQPYDLVARFLDDCHKVGFKHINFDLIYGLPHQTLTSVQETVQKTIQLKPSRIAFYRMAMIPEIFKWQRRFGPEDLPDSESCLAMNLHAINTFQNAGYRFIGLDHFALPTDPLFTAQKNGTINRNFQGMTTGRGSQIISFGPSAISQWDGGYTQNYSDFFRWDKIVRKDYPVDRAYRLTTEDRLRRELLLDLYCYRKISTAKFSALVNNFSEHFSKEIGLIRAEPWNKLVSIDKEGLKLTSPLGELLVRVVAAVFDKHLPSDAFQGGMTGAASRIG